MGSPPPRVPRGLAVRGMVAPMRAASTGRNTPFMPSLLLSTRVAVVIPTYNYAHAIQRAIDSALRQTRPPDEIIVVDDGSTDGTQEAVRRYGPPVRYLYQPNAGGSAARNLAVRSTTCEWIAFLDHDDEWLPEKLKTQLGSLLSTAGAEAGYTAYYIMREGREPELVFPPGPDQIFPRIRINNCIGPTATYLVKRNFFLRCGGFTERLRNSCEDWDLFIRMALSGKMVLCRTPLTRYYDHANCESRKWKMMLARELSIVDSTLLRGLRGWRKALMRWQVLAAIYARAAVGAAECGDPAMALMLRSLAYWPVPGLRRTRYRFVLRRALRMQTTAQNWK